MTNQVIASSQKLKCISSVLKLDRNQTNKATRRNAVTYTMMLLMGMWMSLTKNPMKPMIANPIAVAMAIFWNSRGPGKREYESFSVVPTLPVLKAGKLASPAVYSKSGEWYLTFSIWFGASFDEPNGILDELPAGLNELRYLIHGVWAVGTNQKQITLAASSAWAPFTSVLTLTSTGLRLDC